MIDPKDVLTEQELDHLVELDMSSHSEMAGGATTIEIASAVSTTLMGVTAVTAVTVHNPCPTSACTTRC